LRRGHVKDFTPPVYTPANGAVPSKVTFVMASNAPAGFGTGEFATIVYDIGTGSNLNAINVTQADFKPVDLNGAAVGITAGGTATSSN